MQVVAPERQHAGCLDTMGQRFGISVLVSWGERGNGPRKVLYANSTNSRSSNGLIRCPRNQTGGVTPRECKDSILDIVSPKSHLSLRSQLQRLKESDEETRLLVSCGFLPSRVVVCNWICLEPQTHILIHVPFHELVARTVLMRIYKTMFSLST